MLPHAKSIEKQIQNERRKQKETSNRQPNNKKGQTRIARDSTARRTRVDNVIAIPDKKKLKGKPIQNERRKHEED